MNGSRWRTRSLSIGLGAVVLALLLAGAWWRLSEGREGGGDPDVSASNASSIDDGKQSEALAIPVSVDTVRQGTLILEVGGTGQTEAWDRATISARVAGRIALLPVDESDRVSSGQHLVQLDARQYELAVQDAEAALAQAQARYKEMILFDERIDDAAIRQERSEAARAKSGLAQAEIALNRARLDLANTAVTAPFSGQVADLLVTVGEYVNAGEEVMTVVDIDPILVKVQVVEGELRWLKVGSLAEVRLPAFPDTVFQGRIRSINPVVDPESRTARVVVVLANHDGRILPGMFARVDLEGREFEDRVMVAEDAIVERDNRSLVFVFEPLEDGSPGEGLAKWVYVTPGLSNGESVELIENEETDLPSPGSLVITGGNYTLIHDARVRIASDSERP